MLFTTKFNPCVVFCVNLTSVESQFIKCFTLNLVSSIIFSILFDISSESGPYTDIEKIYKDFIGERDKEATEPLFR
jgi:hypothetical protein